MKIAPVLEINRSYEERVSNLVRVYSQHGLSALIEATLRIKKRLGPQRTNQAITAIEQSDWANACKAMLDYYDRCYDHELSQASQLETVDLSGLNPTEATKKLEKLDLVD